MPPFQSTYPVYEFGAAFPAAAANAAIWELRNPAASGVRLALQWLRAWAFDPFATFVALGRPTAVGTGGTTTQGVRVGWNTAAPLSAGLVASAWGVQPTFPGAPVYMRVGVVDGLTAQDETSVEWSWPQESGNVILPGSSLVLRNVGPVASAIIVVSSSWIEVPV